MQGKTLWEMFLDWWNSGRPVSIAAKTPFPLPQKPVGPYNPLNMKVGSGFGIKKLDFTGITFLVEKTLSYSINYGKVSFNFIDYVSRSSLQEGETINLKLRVYPHEEPGRTLQTLVLKKWDELNYDEGFKALLVENQFNVMNGDDVEASFWRINDVKTAYVSLVREDFSEETKEVWYWDYWRETVDAGGTTYKEFLFVEWDKGDTGMFTLYRGEEVPRLSLTV